MLKRFFNCFYAKPDTELDYPEALEFPYLELPPTKHNFDHYHQASNTELTCKIVQTPRHHRYFEPSVSPRAILTFLQQLSQLQPVPCETTHLLSNRSMSNKY